MLEEGTNIALYAVFKLHNYLAKWNKCQSHKEDNCTEHRGVFRVQSKIYDGFFLQK